MKSFEKISKNKDDVEIITYLLYYLDSSKYHLNVKFQPLIFYADNKEFAAEGKMQVEEWSLYHKYRFSDDYFHPNNEAFMSSKNNTLKDLYDFIKLHERKDLSWVYQKCEFVILLLVILLCGINILYVENPIAEALLHGLVFGMVFANGVYILLHLAIRINQNVDLMEDLEAHRENLKSIKREMKSTKSTVKDMNGEEHEVENSFGKKTDANVVTGIKVNDDGTTTVNTIQSTVDGTKYIERDPDDKADTLRVVVDDMTNEFAEIKVPVKVEIKSSRKKTHTTKPNVRKTTNTAKKVSKTPKKTKSDEEIDRLAEGIKKCGETFDKAGTTVVKRKPGRPKKVKDEKVS